MCYSYVIFFPKKGKKVREERFGSGAQTSRMLKNNEEKEDPLDSV